MSRTLPARANLEFERKEAKALLARLHADDPAALERLSASHPAHRRGRAIDDPTTLKLADAQLVIAREYGFASWPRLARYLSELERDVQRRRPLHGSMESYEGWVRTILAEHSEGRAWAARALAGFVPKFYGQSIDEVLAATVTVEDAQLTVAREHHCTSWEELRERAEAGQRYHARRDPWNRDRNLWVRLAAVIKAADIDALSALIEEHPELLNPSEEDRQEGLTLESQVIQGEQRSGSRVISDWLESQRVDLQPALNRMLVNVPRWTGRMTIENVQYLLDRGAEPSWVSSNGLSVLEHALVRYWNGAAAELIARRVVPKRALWIAAGLGDLDGMRAFFDRDGKLIVAAFRDRPDFGLIGSESIPAIPDPSAVDIMFEAALVALINDRPESIGFLLDHGLPIEHGAQEMSLLSLAIGNRSVRSVELLVARGANLDTKGWRPHASARELARQEFVRDSENEACRRILELCDAGDPEAVLADARASAPEPEPSPQLIDTLELAGDDAARRGQTEIGEDNLLVGLIRWSPEDTLACLSHGNRNLDPLRERLDGRPHPASERIARPKLPFDEATRPVIARASTLARERQHPAILPFHLLEALVENSSGSVPTLLASVGVNLEALREELRHF